MKNAGFTRQERSFIALMRIWAVAFFLTAILFAVAPDYTINYLTSVGTEIFGWQSDPIQFGNERFWLVLAITLLVTLSYISAIVQRNLLRNIGYARPVIVAKLFSSVGFIFALTRGQHHFIYLAGAIVDGLIFLITWRMYAKAVKSRV